jgi:putative tryptophan/tyrosine transport system substrate-binding protein
MRRREFITFLGGAAIALPPAARAQQPVTREIGFLHSASANTFALAADLVNRQVSAIFAGGPPAALAAKAATDAIPIVFTSSDPVKAGLVTSLNRPGGNATGVSFFVTALGAKRLELLRELVPRASIGMLVNPNFPATEDEVADVREAARVRGEPLQVLQVSNDPELDAAFVTISQQRIGGLLVASDVFLDSRRDQLALLTARHAVPAIYYWREFAAAGGLMSYGNSITEGYRQAGVYVGQILDGAKPGDLPVLQPTKFDLVINLKAAKLIGVAIPNKLLALADEVIE